MTLLTALLTAVQSLPSADFITKSIRGQTMLTLTQKIIAALFSMTDKEQYGFVVCEEPQLIERIIEAVELPMTGESYLEVKTKLPGLSTPLKGVGIEITRAGDYLTVWGPGVKRHG